MHATKIGLGEKAFGDSADSRVIVTSQSHRDSLKFIRDVLKRARGIGVLHGPPASGKSTIMQRLREALPNDISAALVDGTDIRPRELLTEMLRQFGYETNLETAEELLQMVGVFAVQQTGSAQSPILIIDNAEHVYPGTLRILDRLAGIMARHKYALRILLTARSEPVGLLDLGELDNIAKRGHRDYAIGPMSSGEAAKYLHARLSAVGVRKPSGVFPGEECLRLHKLSGGWPGLLNHYALEALRPERPRLIVTRDGEVVANFKVRERKTLIGRSEFADLVIEDRFASKMHAALVLYSNALVLLDLNSANGTTVNSVRLKSAILKDDDIIVIGNYRLKVYNAPAVTEQLQKELSAADTVKMKSLADLQRLQALQKEIDSIYKLKG